MWSGAIACVLAVGVGAPVAATWLYDTQTGKMGTGGEAVASAEWLDAEEHDFATYAKTLLPDWLPLPDSVDRVAFQTIESDRIASAYGKGLVQDVTVRAHYEFAAQCVWIDEAMLAHQSGDTGRLAKAVDVLGAAPTWPDIVASDGGGVADAMGQTAAAAANGDVDVLKKRIGCLSDWRVATYKVDQ